MAPEPEPTPEKPFIPGTKINGKPSWRYTRPMKKQPGELPITGKDVPGLDSTALMPLKVDPETVILRNAKKLGVAPSIFEKAAFRARRELGKYMSMQITAQVLGATNFDNLEQVANCMKMCKEIMGERDTAKVSTQDKLMAAKMLTLAAESFDRLSRLQLDLAAESADKEVSNLPRKNLPPQVNLQVNVAGGTSPPPATSARNGTTIDADASE